MFPPWIRGTRKGGEGSFRSVRICTISLMRSRRILGTGETFITLRPRWNLNDVYSRRLKSSAALTYMYALIPPFHLSNKGSDCCSDSAISFHYVSPRQMRILEYLIYQLRPFGIPADGRPAMPDPPPDSNLTATPWFASNNETTTDPTTDNTSIRA
jgi:hypothetical protein